MRERLLNVAMVLMVFLAVTSTAYTFERQRRIATADAAAEIVVERQADWRNYVAGTHVFGPADARVTIIEFADFQCPYCESLSWSIDTLRSRHPIDVRFVFRHFPLPIHRFAVAAAMASECADQQDRFEPMLHQLFGHQDSLGVASFIWFARSAGIPDLRSFDACMKSARPLPALARDTADAMRLGLGATPALLINDLRIEGLVSLDSLEAYVSRAGGSRSSR